MANDPCRPSCPAGDCAGCAFPPRLQRCIPERTCRQSHCARRDPSLAHGKPIDGTVIHIGRFCPLFVDARHPMLEAV